jgi:hypothetical protein
MVPAIIAFLALLLAVCSARADLDLTPIQGVKTLERMKVTDVLFHDGPTEIRYQPPRGWICSGSQASVVLNIPENRQARAYIQSAAHLRIPAFDDKAAKLFQQNPGLLQLPKGARNINITALTVNPFMIDSHSTLEVKMTYSFFGQNCARSILLIDRKGAEVSFVLDCPGPDFNLLFPKFRASLFTIENL